MNPSKLFITSLLAAAAMSVPAFGATVNGITWTDSADGTVRTFTGTATNYVKINGTRTNEGLNGATNVTKVIFNSVGGTGDAAWFTNTTMSQAIELQGTGLVIKGGTNYGAAVFTGAITGGESSSFTWLGDSAAGNSQQFTFSGDLTGFSGSFVRTTASYSDETKTGAIFFGADTATTYSSSATATDGVISNISGTGSITTSAGVVYNYTAASGETPAYTTLSVNNSSITAKTLTFGGGATYTVASMVTGQNSTASNNTLTISAGTTTFTGSIANFGTITVAGGATADFSNTTFKFGTLTADSVTTTISNSGTVTFGEGTIFDVDSAASLVRGAQLLGGMSGQTQTFSIANLSVGGYLVNQRGNATFSVSDSGVLTLDSYTEGANYSLTWNGGDSGVWKLNGTGWTTTDTTGEVTFQNGDSVTFGTGTTNAARLEGSLKVGTLTTSAATTLSVADGSTALVTTGTLSLSANLTINKGVTLKMTQTATGSSNVTNMFSNVAGTGTLSIILPDSNGLGVNAPNFAGTLYIQKPSGSESRLQLTSTTLADGASIELADGADLVLNAKVGRFSHDIKINGTTELYFNGSSSDSVEFSGDITGAGTLSIVSNNNPRTLVLSGNVVLGGLSVSAQKSLKIAGTANIGALTVSGGTLNISGATLSGATALNFTAASGNVNFEKADGADSATYDIGAISFNNSNNTGRNMTIDEGVTVNAASLSAAYAFGTVTVNGALNLNDAISVKPGNTPNANTITGSGSVSTTGVTIGNAALSVCTISVREISIGSGGITTENSKTLTLGGDTTVKAAAAWTSSATLALLSGTAGTTFNTNGNDLALNGRISGAGKLVKTGAGTLTLSGNNTFTGGIEIAKGVVEATNAAALGVAANAVRISGGQLSIGSSTTAGVALNQTAITVVLGNAYKTTTALVGENGGALATGTTVTVDATDLNALGLVAGVANEYSIWNESLETSGVTLELSGAFRTLLADAGWTSSISGGTLTISAIPEPSVFGLLAGLGGLALAGTRRRRRK